MTWAESTLAQSTANGKGIICRDEFPKPDSETSQYILQGYFFENDKVRFQEFMRSGDTWASVWGDTATLLTDANQLVWETYFIKTFRSPYVWTLNRKTLELKITFEGEVEQTHSCKLFPSRSAYNREIKRRLMFLQDSWDELVQNNKL